MASRSPPWPPSQVIDYDRICVMNAGTVAEYDSPHALLQSKDGLFAALVDATGAESAAELRERAAAHQAVEPLRF